MKHILLAITVPAIVALAACSIQVSPLTQATANNTPTDSAVVHTIPTTTSMPTTANNPAEEADIRDLVEEFGKRLQIVSLQSPDAAQELQKQYSEFVSPTLLETWLSDISKAPGRMVSSPWPDRIEITSLSSEGSDRYEITGSVVEITSTEVGSDEAAAKIPVRIVVQRAQGGWLISEYAEER